MKLYRNLIILFIIVASLGAGYYFVYKYEPSEENKEVETSLKTVSVFKTDKENLKSVEVISPDESYRISIGKNGKWIVNNDESIRVSQSKIDTLLYDVASISAQEIVAENVTDFYQYGLDTPKRKVIITTKDGQNVTFLVGDKTVDGANYFVMLDGKSTVYIKRASGVESLTKSIYDLRDTTFYSVSEQDIVKITIQKTGSDRYVIERENEGTKEEPSYIWKIKEPLVGEADEYILFDKIVPKITALNHHMSSNGNTEAECGLLNPYAAYSVATDKESYLVTIGNKEGEYRYVKVSGYDGFYLVKNEEIDFIELRYTQVMNKLIHLEKINDVNGVTISGNGKSFTLTHTGSSETDTYTINDKILGEKEYKKAYQAVLGVALEDYVNENVTGMAEVTISYDRKDGKKSEVTFISYDERNYIVKVNGEGNLKIKKKQIEEIFDKLSQIYNS